MIGVFVQMNNESHVASRKPTGYVITESGCWEWVGSLSRGYARVHNVKMTGQSKSIFMHRWMYEKHVGPIPNGLTIDHLCKNKACINPSHLEPVTAIENSRRAGGWAGNGLKTHCPVGHPLVEGNLIPTQLKYGSRSCKECNRTRNRHSMRRKHGVKPESYRRPD